MMKSKSVLYWEKFIILIHNISFDVDLPSVLADEVDTPMQTSLTYFNSLIKLHGVLGDVLRTIVSVNNEKFKIKY